MERTLSVPLLPQTFAFGNSFEHFVITEIFRLCEYRKNDYQLSYLLTKDNVEIDMIIVRPGQPDLLIEIKSTDKVQKENYKSLKEIMKDWDAPCEAQVWSLDSYEKRDDQIHCLHWIEGLKGM